MKAKHTKQIVGKERGSILIIVVVLLTALLGFAGLTIDFGNFYLQKARMQSLADASALACAQFDCAENDPRLDAVKSPYDMQGVTLRITQLDVCSEQYPAECAIADVHKQWDTYFIQLFGVPKLSVATSATALVGLTEEAESKPSEDPVLMALATNGAGINFTRYNNVAGFNIYGEVVSNSSNNPNITANAYWDNSYPILVNGNIFTRTQTNQSVRAASGYSTKQISQPIEDPCTGEIETPSFPANCNWLTCPAFESNGLNCVSGLTHTIPSGTYSWININARKMDHANQGIIPTCKYRMKGVYKITGGLSIDVQGVRGGVDATDAVFLFGPNAKQVNIAMRAQENKENPESWVVFKAPTSGSWKGILFYHPTGNIEFNGFDVGHASNVVSMDGLTYAPKGKVWVNKNGSPGAIPIFGNIIAKEISLTTNDGSNTLIRPASMESVCSIGSGGGEDPTPTRRRRSRLIQ